ncbi:SH3 domain-binding protein 5-like [Notothenia coriiceps]|uniref:SH3 domain-binding protein 5 n=1 Tax=Notothenia coriiceps TaxID=8208 RepID=A0A6I9MW30_9TELE|nr:PREDICTED: SH3 domain-binding protein 5-like [Notothenia coriiceps]
MEPGTSSEIRNGSGFPEPTGPREETPGEEARGGMLKRRGAEAEPAEEMEADCENEPEHQRNTGGEEEAGKHEEELDPRIQDELEQLNQASDEINKLELQLDEARSSYRRILTDSARRLNAQGSQLGACIEKARPYYEARRLAKEHEGRGLPASSSTFYQVRIATSTDRVHTGGLSK